MKEQPDVDDLRFMRFLNKLVWASIPILFSLVGWAGAQVVDHETRLQIIEKSRFSREDGAAEREQRIAGDNDIRFQILETLKAIDKRLADLERGK